MKEDIQVQLSKTSTPFQIDGFPEGARRSVKGSLHFRPGSCRLVTEDELSFIKTRFPGYYVRLWILKVEKPAASPTSPSSPSTSSEEGPVFPRSRSETESKLRTRKRKKGKEEIAD